MSYEKLAQDIGRLVDEKSRAYGDSAGVAGEFFKLLFPDGIPVSQYNNVLLFARMFDKIKRIATDRDSFNEDPFNDLVGYALLGAAARKKEPSDANVNEVQAKRIGTWMLRDGITATVVPAPGTESTTAPTALQPCTPHCEVCADLKAKAAQ